MKQTINPLHRTHDRVSDSVLDILDLSTNYLKLDASNDPITGDLSLTSSLSVSGQLSVGETKTNLSGTVLTSWFVTGAAPITNSSASFSAIKGDISNTSNVNFTSGNALRGFFGGVSTQGTGLVAGATALDAVNQTSVTGGQVTNWNGLRTFYFIDTGITATVGTYIHLNVGGKTGSGTFNVTNHYGLKIANISGASTLNYSIFTGTGINQLGDQLNIIGSGDRIQLLVKGNATQTSDFMEIQSSGSAVRFKVDKNFSLSVLPTSTDQSVALVGATITSEKVAAGSDATQNSALNITQYLRGSQNYTNNNYGIQGFAYNNGTGTASTLTGMQFGIGSLTNGGNITTGNCLFLQTFGSGSGVVANVNGVVIASMNAYNTPTTSKAIKIVTNTVAQGTSKYGIAIEDFSGATNNYAIQTNAGNIVFNEGGDASTDFRVESDTEANMLFLDANADTDGALYLGGSTNGVKVNKGGDVKFIGTGSGLQYGSMYAEDAAITTTLTNANTYYGIASGMTGGSENGCTFQNTKEIKILTAGIYEVSWSMSISVNASDQTIEGLVMAGASGTTAQVQCGNATRAKENGVVYSVSGVGLVTCAVDDLIRFGLENETSAGTVITVSHANMTIKQIGA